jgi:tetratricopeptide (TPR) repeat protein
VWIGHPWSYSYYYDYYYPYYPYGVVYDYGPDYYYYYYYGPYGPGGAGPSVYQEPAYPGVVEQDPILLGFQYFAQGQYVRAKGLFRRAVALQPKDAYARFVYAQALFALGEYRLAADAIRRGLVLDPTWPEWGIDVRSYYADPSEFTAQLARLEDHVADHPDDTDARFLLAYNLYFSGEGGQALEEFTRLADANPLDRGPELFLKQLRGTGRELGPGTY